MGHSESTCASESTGAGGQCPSRSHIRAGLWRTSRSWLGGEKQSRRPSAEAGLGLVDSPTEPRGELRSRRTTACPRFQITLIEGEQQLFPGPWELSTDAQVP